jgi:hypothetical protein
MASQALATVLPANTAELIVSNNLRINAKTYCKNW